MSDDIVDRLRIVDGNNGGDSDHLFDGLLMDAADDIELARSHITDLNIEIERLRKRRDELFGTAERLREERDRAQVSLARYKRMYARQACGSLYAVGARWKIRENPMRSDGVFIEEDHEPGRQKTWWAFPCQFDHDVAKEIVELLNRATDEMKSQDAERKEETP
jgi:hypothetical protein